MEALDMGVLWMQSPTPGSVSRCAACSVPQAGLLGPSLQRLLELCGNLEPLAF